MHVPRRVVVVCLVAVALTAALGPAQAQVGARAMGMGGAFVGLADDATATYYNPAALVFLPCASLTYTHASENQSEAVVRDLPPLGASGTLRGVGLIRDFASYVTPFDEQTAVGLSYLNSILASASMYDADLQGMDTVEWKEHEYWLSAGYKFGETTAVGANFRWITDNISVDFAGFPSNSDSDSAWALDVALFQRFQENVTGGLIIRNLNQPSLQHPMDLVDVHHELPITGSIGAAAKMWGLTAAVQIEDVSDAVNRAVRFGVEQCFTRDRLKFALRAGWFGDESALTLGAGVIYSGWSADVAVVDVGSNATWLVGVTGIF